jgi:hypothetical protein
VSPGGKLSLGHRNRWDVREDFFSYSSDGSGCLLIWLTQNRLSRDTLPSCSGKFVVFYSKIYIEVRSMAESVNIAENIIGAAVDKIPNSDSNISLESSLDLPRANSNSSATTSRNNCSSHEGLGPAEGIK